MVLGLMEFQRRREEGVGMQNFNHTPAILQFANEVVTRSPELYRMIRHCLLPHLPTEQFLQYAFSCTANDHN